MTRFLLVLVLGSAVFLSSCKKSDKGETGPAGAIGATGAAGEPGNANVHTTICTIHAGDWAVSNNNRMVSLNSTFITAEVIDSGTIQVFMANVALPFSSGSNQFNYMVFPGYVEVIYSLDNGNLPQAILSDINFKVVAIEGSVKENPGE